MSSASATETPTGPAEPTGTGGVEIDSHFDGDNAGADGNGDSDRDSSLSTGLSTGTTSISPSVFEFTYANGRRYASDRFSKADYVLPNDEIEQSRLDLYHHIFLMLLGGHLYTAPLFGKHGTSSEGDITPHRVLDIGTGTGIWAIDFADLHPATQVIGNDISPIQPSWVPPNVKFEVDDVEETWTHPDGYFDYVHMRSLSGSISDWPRLLLNAWEKMAPGGWIEFQDYGCEGFQPDGTALNDLPADKIPNVGKWFAAMTAAAHSFGRPLTIARDIEEHLKAAGFVDIRVKKKVWPLSPWPKDKALKEIGRWALLGCEETVYPYALGLLSKVGWSEPEIRKLCDGTLWELTKGKKKFYGEAWFVCGRKPVE